MQRYTLFSISPKKTKKTFSPIREQKREHPRHNAALAPQAVNTSEPAIPSVAVGSTHTLTAFPPDHQAITQHNFPNKTRAVNTSEPAIPSVAVGSTHALTAFSPDRQAITQHNFPNKTRAVNTSKFSEPSEPVTPNSRNRVA